MRFAQDGHASPIATTPRRVALAAVALALAATALLLWIVWARGPEARPSGSAVRSGQSAAVDTPMQDPPSGSVPVAIPLQPTPLGSVSGNIRWLPSPHPMYATPEPPPPVLNPTPTLPALVAASEHLDLELLTRIVDPGHVTALDASNGHAYAAVGSGVTVLDVSEPEQYQPVAWLDTASHLPHLVARGDYLYGLGADSWLLVIDVETASDPQVVGRYGPVDASPLAMAIDVDHAYVAMGVQAGSSGGDAAVPEGGGAHAPPAVLHVIDISHREDPRELTTLALPDAPNDIAVGNGRAAIAYDHGAQILAIGNPESPRLGGLHVTNGAATGVAVHGESIYVTEAGRRSGMDEDGKSLPSRLTVLDVSDPDLPREALAVPFDEPDSRLLGVRVVDNRAYVLETKDWFRDVYDLHVFDLSQPIAPVGPRAVQYMYFMGWPPAVDGDRIYLRAPKNGLATLERDESFGATQTGLYLLMPAAPVSIAVGDEFAYVLDGHTAGLPAESPGHPSLWVFDVGDPSRPRPVGQWDDLIWTSNVAVNGTRAYQFDGGSSALRVIDISNPSELRESTIPTPRGPAGSPFGAPDQLVLLPPHAFVADSQFGMRVFDISRPDRSAQIGASGIDGGAHALAVSGDMAYAMDWDTGLWIFDVSDPAHPTELGVLPIDTGGALRQLEVVADHAYVYDSNCGPCLVVVDVSYPSDPHEVARRELPDVVGATLHASQNRLFVCGRNGVVQVIDVSDPMRPVLSAQVLGLPGWRPAPVTIEDDTVYLAVEDAPGVVVVRE